MDKLSTHYYDGKLSLSLSVMKSTEEKNTIFRAVLLPLIANSKDINKDNAISATNLIINDYKNNYDGTDSLYACDLLYLICDKINNNNNIWIDLLLLLREAPVCILFLMLRGLLHL